MSSGIEPGLEMMMSASGVGALWRENAALKQENGRLAQALEHERAASAAYKNERNALEDKIHEAKADVLRRAEATERRAVEAFIAARKALASCRAVLSRAEFSLEDSARESGIDLDASEG